jgi:hypothetical protein
LPHTLVWPLTQRISRELCLERARYAFLAQAVRAS